jgi:hypothetical protein
MEGSLVAYKVFTNGSVLPASDVNTYLMDQSVMVFSSSTTRAAALPAPVEGMLTWLEDVNRYENYNGTAWVVLGNSGLELIKTQTVGTTVSSVAVTGVFSATYDQYKIVLSGGASSANTSLNLKLGAASNGHNTQFIFSTWTSTSGSPTLNGGANAANFTFVGSGLTSTLSMSLDVINPFTATPTQLWGLGNQNSSTSGLFQGYHTASTSFTDFTISTVTGTLTGGNIAVYGYRRA